MLHEYLVVDKDFVIYGSCDMERKRTFVEDYNMEYK